MAATRQRLLPQFSLRLIMGVTAATAVICAAGAWATQGRAWAVGIVAAVVVTLAAFAVFALLYLLAWMLAIVARRKENNNLPPEQKPPASAEPESTTVPPSATACLIIAGLVNTVLAATAWAGSGGSVTLPFGAAGTQNPTGLTLKIDTAWVDSTGYRPVRVELTSITGPVASDRVLTLRFRPRIGLTNRDSIIVEQTIEIPAGQSAAKATIAVPQLTMWGSFILDTFEDGEYVAGLSVPDNVSWTSWAGTFDGDSALPTAILLSDISETALNVGPVSPPVIYFLPDGKSSPLSAGGSPIRTYADLPTRWIDYSGVDMMIVNFDDLQNLAQDHATAWNAIGQWIRNEGTLVVYGVGEKWEGLDALQTLLEIQSTSDADDPAKRGWNPPKREVQSVPLLGIIDYSRQPIDSQPTDDETPRTPIPSDQAPFITHACGLGLVAAIRSGEKFDAAAFDWKWLYNSIGPERWQWSLRHGLSIVRDNQDYWNFMIPGIGLPPVGLFQVLITLFVIVIGPVSYYLLRRRGILNMMIVTVPTAALLVTATLFAYAYLADGLGVRLRARSVTHIDQRLGEASCWARLSYYAGIAPGSGLTFSDDLVAFPLELTPRAANHSVDDWETRRLDWRRRDAPKADSALQQNLTDGWLKSRTATQFITGRIRQSPVKLDVTPGADGKPLEIVNRLGVPIEKLVVIDDAGTCWTGEAIAAEQSTPLTVIESQAAAWIRLFSTLWNDNAPRVPEEIEFYQQGPEDRIDNPRSQIVPPSQSLGNLERSLTEIKEKLSSDRLPKRTYVAIVPSSPEVELGIPNVQEESSFHVIIGRW